MNKLSIDVPSGFTAVYFVVPTNQLVPGREFINLKVGWESIPAMFYTDGAMVEGKLKQEWMPRMTKEGYAIRNSKNEISKVPRFNLFIPTGPPREKDKVTDSTPVAPEVVAFFQAKNLLKK